VRALGADAGIVITASHNPPEYNGYKVYGPDGCQLVPGLAEQVIGQIRSVGSFADIKRMSRGEAEAAGRIVWLGEREDRMYHETVAAESLRPELLKSGAGDELSIIYTPLHGSGNVPVREVLKLAGFGNVRVVAEQEQP